MNTTCSTTLFITLLFILNGCSRLSPEMPGGKGAAEQRISGRLPQFIPGCPPCKDYSAEGMLGLPVRAAAKMSNLYSANHYPQYIINGNVPDAKSVWFNLDTLKKFIYKIEQAMCQCPEKPSLGIRIYFGEYPSPTAMSTDGYFSNINPQMAYRHTLFMVPTYSANNADNDFDPWHLGGNCTQPQTICQWFGGPDSSFFANTAMLALSPDDSQGSKNHGNLCPPLCPTGSSCFPVALPAGGPISQ